MKTTEMQDHIDELAALHGIVVQQRYNLPGMMYCEEQPPRIEGPSIAPCDVAPSSNICYMANLHEIGHVLHGHTQGRPPYEDQTYYFDHGVLRCEAEAWNFALDECRVKLSKRDCAYMADRYFGSYIMAARRANGKGGQRLPNGNRHWVEFTYDDPDDPYVQTTFERLSTAWKEAS